MAKSNSIFENTKVDIMESFILDTLLRGVNVVIPDFGHLELKNLGERRTVLFKSADINDSFLRIVPADGDEKEKREFSALYTNISIPLKEGKTVNLPQIGVFTPKKRENGDIFISFMLSSSLRNLLNKGGETIKDIKVGEDIKKEASEVSETSEILNTQENSDEAKSDEVAIVNTSEIEKENSWKPERVSLLPNNNSNDISSDLKRKPLGSYQKSQVVDTQEDTQKTTRRPLNISGVLLIVAAILLVIIIAVTAISSRHNKKIEEQISLSNGNTSELIDLTVLANQHYGNPAYWIYIYEANLDKLDSPINIPKDVSLVIPDLKTEYNIDVTDSVEIKKANALAEIILKKDTNTNK